MNNIPLPLILASTSPARKKLLERLQIPFTIAPADVDETPLPNESPYNLVRRLAELKARTVAAKFPNSLIIGADQVVVLENTLQNKPITHENAVKQLTAASGKDVVSLTGLCLLNTQDNSMQLDVARFDVFYRELSQETIEWYLAKDQPYQCAGSIRAEELGIVLIKETRGKDPTALTGLPLIMLVDMINEATLSI
jgi:MAF protein